MVTNLRTDLGSFNKPWKGAVRHNEAKIPSFIQDVDIIILNNTFRNIKNTLDQKNNKQNIFEAIISAVILKPTVTDSIAFYSLRRHMVTFF